MENAATKGQEIKRQVNEEQLVERGVQLANEVATKVRSGQIGQALAHLRRHRDPAATLRLVKALPSSSFGRRTGKTREQLEALARHVAPILKSYCWQDAAVILGWAQRLTKK